MLGSSPARITKRRLRLMDRTPASPAGNAGSIPAGVTIIHGGCSQAVRQRIVVPPIAGSIPVIYPKNKTGQFRPVCIWVSRLAAMASHCKCDGYSYVGSSPTCPTNKPPDLSFKQVRRFYYAESVVNLFRHRIILLFVLL